MKRQNFLLAIILLMCAGFSSCSEDKDDEKTYIVTFEDVSLNSLGYWNGSDTTGSEREESEWGVNYYGSFTSGRVVFDNVYTIGEGYDYWGGFACSKHTDVETPGIINQYSAITGIGANGSEKYAIAFSGGATFHIPQNESGYAKIKSMMVTNSTYAYHSMKDGDYYTKQFDNGDWFKVTIKGYRNGNEVGSVDYYLVDFRNGKNFISKNWEKVNLNNLGEVDQISFFFSSTDNGEYGMNNPAYVCIDNIEFTRKQ